MTDNQLYGYCEHCDDQLIFAATSHATMVERYQDHLREEHPRAWLHT